MSKKVKLTDTPKGHGPPGKFSTTEYKTISEWLDGRDGSVTGSSVKSLKSSPRSGLKLDGEYVNAQTLVVTAGLITAWDEREGEMWHNDAERGLYLESEALEAVNAESTVHYIKCDKLIWRSQDNPLMAVSPDSVSDYGTSFCETKCLSSAKHLLAILARAGNADALDMLFKEFGNQVAEYFVVNDQLETGLLAFYDPRFVDKANQLVLLPFSREDEMIQDLIHENEAVGETTKRRVRGLLKIIKARRDV